MALIQQIRASRRSFHTALLVAFSLLNGLYIQSVTVMPLAPNHPHAEMSSHTGHSENAAHAMHEAAKPADCGSDAVCKTQCAWHCQLSQAMQPLSGVAIAHAQIIHQSPSYYSAIQPKSWLDLKLRPPISS
jgi:hypothetical protein